MQDTNDVYVLLLCYKYIFVCTKGKAMSEEGNECFLRGVFFCIHSIRFDLVAKNTLRGLEHSRSGGDIAP